MKSIHNETNSTIKPLLNRSSDDKDSKPLRPSHIANAVQSIHDLDICDNNEVGFSDNFISLESSSRSFKLSFLAIFIYLLIGTLIYKAWMDGWTVIDAMYFTVVTFTTVGYGDLVPDGYTITVFTTVFVFIGIIVLGGVALPIIFDQFFYAYEDISKKVTSRTTQHYLNLFHGTIFGRDDDDCKESLVAENFRILINTTPLLIALIIPALVTGYIEGWSISKSFYFSAITATTGKA